jgi:hypothetical protein
MEKEEMDKIREWMRVTYDQGLYANFHDLHIDEIGPAGRDRSNWISYGCDCLVAAISIKRELSVPLQIALAFSLKSERTPLGINFAKVDEFQGELDSSPPSLYLVTRGMFEPAVMPEAKEIGWVWLKLGPEDSNCYYFEYRTNEDEDYRRSLWIVAANTEHGIAIGC